MVNTAVFGYGLMGQRHARVYRELPGCRLVAVADADPGRRELAGRDSDVSVYATARDLLADPSVEAVSICLPDSLHREAVTLSLQAGKHVLVEKPLTCDTAEAGEIIAAYEASRAKLMVGFLLRFDPRYAAACELVRSGQLGEVIHIASRRNSPITGPRRYRGAASLPFHVASHELDLILWCLGTMPVSVYAAGVSKLLREEGLHDTILVTMEFPDGALASLECSWALPETSPTALDARFQVVGTAGQVTVDTAHQGLTVVDARGTAYPDTMRWTEIQGRAFGALQNELAHFVAAIEHDTAPVNDVYQGARVTRLAQVIEESLKSGVPVRLER